MEHKKELLLDGLGCASCAAKIEEQVGQLEGVETADVNFLEKKLTIYWKEAAKLDEILLKAKQIVHKIESQVVVKEKEQKETDAAREVLNSFWTNGSIKELYGLGIGGGLFLLALLLPESGWVSLVLYIISYFIIGGKVVERALKNIVNGQVFDENFLMTIATLGAFAIKEYPEAVAVMLFYQVGEWFQEMAVNRSRKSIKSLLNIRPDYANLVVSDSIKQVSPEEVTVGDLIIVKPGERVPLDGSVVEGNSFVDTSALTGEALPEEVAEGSEVLGGYINQNGLIKIKVTKPFKESTVAKILDLVENAGANKAPTENFITRFARGYTPAVVFAALALAILPPFLVPGAKFSDWLYRALVFLVISCPCALVVSIPLGFFGGIGGASRAGIMIKGGNYLEALNQVHTVVFDKTGTLTKGIFKVTKVHGVKPFDQAELLRLAAYAESYSNHPIANSIREAYGNPIDQTKIIDYQEIPGKGIAARIEGQAVLIGNEKLMEQKQIAFEIPEELGTILHVGVDGKYAGFILIADEIKKDSRQAVQNLRALGVKSLIMLTGDSHPVGRKVARELGLDQVYTELLPDQKVAQLERIMEAKTGSGKVIFVGDGVNDAPVLARADIGIAMGALGSDAAIEAADVVLMTDEPLKIATAIRFARKTKSILWQNIIFSLGVKALVLLLGAVGLATLWEAVFADVGVALLAVLNSMRAMGISK